MYAGLPEEIWTRILGHVKLPIPPPNSGMDALIGQDDLATCMRVSSVSIHEHLFSPGSIWSDQCMPNRLRERRGDIADAKAFNNFTAPILYHHAVADSTQRLIMGAEGTATKPAHPCIRNKVELLHLIKHLYIEYHSMEVFLPLREVMDLRRGELTAAKAWSIIGNEHDKFSAMQESVERFKEDFDIFCGAAEDGVPIFKLDTLALGSIRGEDPCWINLWPEEGELPEMVPPVVRGLERDNRAVQQKIPVMIVNLGVKHFCTRAVYGPLKLPTCSALPLRRDTDLVKEARKFQAKVDMRPEEGDLRGAAWNEHYDDLGKVADLTKEPRIIAHIATFDQIALMGNAHVHHYYEPGAPKISLDNLRARVIEPIHATLLAQYDHKPKGTAAVCADPLYKPYIHFYSRVSPGSLRDSMLRKPASGASADERKRYARRLEGLDEMDGPMFAGMEVGMVLDDILPFKAKLEWRPPFMADRCQACGVQPE